MNSSSIRIGYLICFLLNFFTQLNLLTCGFKFLLCFNSNFFFTMKNLFAFSLVFVFSFSNAQNLFIPNEVNYRVWGTQNNIIALDLDQDGDQDVISISAGSGGVMLGENINNEHFQFQELIGLPSGHREIDSGDLDGDGDVDFVVCTSLGSVHWIENNGSLNFTSHEIDTVGIFEDILMVDLDGDGDQDMVSSNFDTDEIHWYENDGSQVFSLNTISFPNLTLPSEILAEDFDGDGDMDLACMDYFHELFWFENDGMTNFTINTIQSYGYVKDIESSDLDDDGDMDIQIVENGLVYWLENDGLGSFSNSLIINASSTTLACIFTEDIDQDGDQDICLHGNEGLFWYENDGSENFTENSIPGDVPANSGVSDMVFLTDMDNDTDIDIISCPGYYGDIELYANDGSQNFEVFSLTGQSMQVNETISVDLDGDGDNDLISANGYNVRGLIWHENVDDEFFVHHPIADSCAGVRSIKSVDLDSDGDMDLVIGNNQGPVEGVIWLVNDGNQQFSYQVVVDSVPFVKAVEVMDFDGDGDQDIVYANTGFSPTLSQEIVWCENDGLQNFTENTLYTGLYLVQMLVEDLDSDSDPDIVLSTGQSGNSVLWLENDGNQNFVEYTVSANVPGAWGISVRDLDEDGDLDIVSASPSDDKLSWHENDGTQGFTEHVISNTLIVPHAVAVADMDNDSDLDIVVSIEFDGEIHWYDNDGNENFTDHLVAEGQWSMESILANDFDGDGDIDIITSNKIQNSVVVNENVLINDLLQISCIPFVDANLNGVLDSTELIINNAEIDIDSNPFYESVFNGVQLFFIQDSGVYTISLDGAIWNPTDSLYRTITVDTPVTTGIDTSIFIGVNPVNDILLGLDITGGRPRCGQTVLHRLTLSNWGNTIDSGYVYYELDDSLAFVSATPAPSATSGQTLTFDIEDLPTGQNQNIDVYVEMPQTITGMSHQMIASIDTGTLFYVDSLEYVEEVLCSFDPNDKQVIPQYTDAGYILAENELEYIVRFQNTGNDTAYYVEIQDVIDDNLDLGSIELVASSHPVEMAFDYITRMVRFKFENINLVDSLTNEVGSQGFVKYSIRPSANLPEGTQIENTAAIYFDGNAPIITNTTLNTLFDCASLAESISVSDTIFYLGWNMPLNISIGESYVNTAVWELDGVPVTGSEDGLEYTFTEEGEYTLHLSLENDLCSLDTTFYFEVIDNMGVNELSGNMTMDVYPNPTNGAINIQLDKPYEQVEVSVFSCLGQLVSKTYFQKEALLDMKIEGAEGLYFIEVKADKESSGTIKVLKY